MTLSLSVFLSVFSPLLSLSPDHIVYHPYQAIHPTLLVDPTNHRSFKVQQWLIRLIRRVVVTSFASSQRGKKNQVRKIQEKDRPRPSRTSGTNTAASLSPSLGFIIMILLSPLIRLYF
ncbi:uncharacterized protein BDW47DRAFT_44794 [Aspergillus candidus]|uniref:Uncharacterized protein n=1 Tax=Aspergillus candidus TaxID=41067 RepID=A0A2I2F8R5_ASPCN|nr:hypothetical protein BDW47DRAFT_44794 [Aspergillus candidus]PLB37013.1 hypothetical protein BDW47DRAFT_44794 [Aspergillus candidus]